MTLINPSLVRSILSGFSLPVMGMHGLPHWGRVLDIGLRLAEETNASKKAVALFAVFHDSRRENESVDPGHGRRGATLMADFGSTYLGLSNRDFELVRYACEHHTDGLTEGDITVQTCWDADRLDLPRVGIVPQNELLCTEAARNPELQRWGAERGVARYTPRFVIDEWLAHSD